MEVRTMDPVQGYKRKPERERKRPMVMTGCIQKRAGKVK